MESSFKLDDVFACVRVLLNDNMDINLVIVFNIGDSHYFHIPSQAYHTMTLISAMRYTSYHIMCRHGSNVEIP